MHVWPISFGVFSSGRQETPHFDSGLKMTRINTSICYSNWLWVHHPLTLWAFNLYKPLNCAGSSYTIANPTTWNKYKYLLTVNHVISSSMFCVTLNMESWRSQEIQFLERIKKLAMILCWSSLRIDEFSFGWRKI
jgi:hypothetical protein